MSRATAICPSSLPQDRADAKKPLKVDVFPAAKLPKDHLAAWSQIQQADPTLANPLFRPEFTQAVAAERPDVAVAVWEQAGEPVGFLPFERTRQLSGRAVGFYINECQGAITRPGLVWSPSEVIRAAGLRSWRFDHLRDSQRAFTPHHYIEQKSIYLDLSKGFDLYRKSRGKSLSEFVTRTIQKDRMAGRELGDVRVEINPADPVAFEQLLQWKIDQTRRTRVPCMFDMDWVIALHKRLLACDTENFAGMYFTLRFGHRLAAGLFGFRSGNVLQGSVLGYDRELSRFAPGFVLMVRVAQFATSLGITRIEMGSGKEPYKEKMASGFEPLYEGMVPTSPAWNPVCRNLYRTKHWLRATKLRGPVVAARAWMFAAKVRLGFNR